MIAELIAGLRGILGGVTDYVGNPLILYAIVLAAYLLYRRTSSSH
jgi:hypothetical protein